MLYQNRSQKHQTKLFRFSENTKIPADKDQVATMTTMRAFSRADMTVYRRTQMMTEAETNKAISPRGSMAGFISERADDFD